MPKSDEHRKLKTALRQTEARLKVAIESLPFDFWMLDESGRYVMQNSRCRELWGEVIGKCPEELDVDEETRALWLSNNTRAFSGEVVREEVQLSVKGEPRFYYNVVSPVLDEGQIIGILGVNLDITTRKLAEEALVRGNAELRRANQRLEQVSRSKDQIMAMISHELRSPLVAGLGYMEMLLDGRLGEVPEKVRAKMVIAHNNLKRLAALIARILKYQQLVNASRPQRINGKMFDLASLVKVAVAEKRETLDNPQRLANVLLENLPAVWGDPDLLRLVLDNLLTNAAVHTGPRDPIRVVAWPEANGVRIAVEDEGPGIPPEVAAHAFEPFVKGSADNPGSGLGLAVVQAILRAHQSEALLESVPGSGTTVSFVLPAASPASSSS